MEKIKISKKEYDTLLTEMFQNMEVDGQVLNENLGKMIVGGIKTLGKIIMLPILIIMNAFRKAFGNKNYKEITGDLKNLHKMTPQQWGLVASDLKKTITKGDRTWWVMMNPNPAQEQKSFLTPDISTEGKISGIQTYQYVRTPILVGIHKNVVSATEVNSQYNPFDISTGKLGSGFKTLGGGTDDYIMQLGLINVKGVGPKMYWTDAKNSAFSSRVIQPLIKNLESYKNSVLTNYKAMFAAVRQTNPEIFKNEQKKAGKLSNWIVAIRGGGQNVITTDMEEKMLQPFVDQTTRDISSLVNVLKEVDRSTKVRWKMIADANLSDSDIEQIKDHNKADTTPVAQTQDNSTKSLEELNASKTKLENDLVKVQALNIEDAEKNQKVEALKAEIKLIDAEIEKKKNAEQKQPDANAKPETVTTAEPAKV